MHTFLPKFLRGKQGCALDTGITMGRDNPVYNAHKNVGVRYTRPSTISLKAAPRGGENPLRTWDGARTPSLCGLPVWQSSVAWVALAVPRRCPCTSHTFANPLLFSLPSPSRWYDLQRLSFRSVLCLYCLLRPETRWATWTADAGHSAPSERSDCRQLKGAPRDRAVHWVASLKIRALGRRVNSSPFQGCE